VTNTGTVAAEQVRVEDRLDDITALPDFRIENISADAGAAWVDSDPPDLVAVVAHLDPGQSVSLALEVSYLFRRLRENTRLRNRVTLTSQTPLSGGSVLQAETTTDIHVG
jgi:hypothetical protein